MTKEAVWLVNVPVAAGDQPAGGRADVAEGPAGPVQAVAGLIQGWLDDREGEDESFPVYARRTSDEELGIHAGLEPVKGRVREEAE